MFNTILQILNLRSSAEKKVLKQYSEQIKKINLLEKNYTSLTDEELRKKTQDFKKELAEGKTIDDLLVEVFAMCREASRRALGQRPYDTQLIGAMALHNGHIAEMPTGEGKTLTAAIAAYLNSLSGESVHIVTANPFLAERDSKWMEKLYNLLDVTTGYIINGQSITQKKEAYGKNIVYATHSEIGYDYLRDNMITSIGDGTLNNRLKYVIIDEADFILIDEARTPLIISGAIDNSPELYKIIFNIIKELKENHINLNEKEKTVQLNDEGIDAIEKLLRDINLLTENETLYQKDKISLLHYIEACLKAQFIYKKEIDYIVTSVDANPNNNRIVIIDENTGRPLKDRRWGNGIHQAIEAKENVNIYPESQTLASITLQNFFRLYEKISGMTGTAKTEADELRDVYSLEVVSIPTNKPLIRIDLNDKFYLTQIDKYESICKDVQERHLKGQPILIGSPSVEVSEIISQMLHALAIPHNVLNAKQNDKESEIIAEAGKLFAVTVSTSMAGRGTDIILGGNPKNTKVTYQQWLTEHEKVKEAGGLHVIGIERNESRRVDNQICGRSGRQGDVGSTQFYLSMEDQLIRIFASESISKLMGILGMKPKECIQSPMLDKAIKNAQKKVEQYYYDIRKNLLKFDDIANDQRKLIYSERNAILYHANVLEILDHIIDQVLDKIVDQALPEKASDEWHLDHLESSLKFWGLNCNLQDWLNSQLNPNKEKLLEHIKYAIKAKIREITNEVPEQVVQEALSSTILQIIDHHWKNHLAMTDHLRQSIHLRSYAQKNPAHEFTQECFELFYSMLYHVKESTLIAVLRLRFQARPTQPIIRSSYQFQTANRRRNEND